MLVRHSHSFGAWILGGLALMFAAAAFGAESPRVLVLPFTALDPSATNTWVGSAIQQNLIANLGGAQTVESGKSSTTQPSAAPDATSALAAGKNVGADYVVYGSLQTQSGQIRVTGALIEVKSGDAIAFLKGTGEQTDLFNLEDILAGQMQRGIKRNQAPTASSDQVDSGIHLSPGSKVIDIEPSGALRTSYLPPAPETTSSDAGLSQYYSTPDPNQTYSNEYNRYRFDTTPNWYPGYFGYYPYGGYYGCTYIYGRGPRGGFFIGGYGGRPTNFYGVSVTRGQVNPATLNLAAGINNATFRIGAPSNITNRSMMARR